MNDPILLWNDVSLEANRISHTNGQGEQAGPPLSARALAIIHLAMYDAFAGITNDPTNLPPYLPGLPTPGSGATIEAAVAGAAHRTLSVLFPSQRAYFDLILSVAGDEGSAGHIFGVAVGDSILDDRKDDPGVGAASYMPPGGRGKHRPDPDNPEQGFHAPVYGARSKGFATATRYELAAPPFNNGQDGEYLTALRQVRGMGIRPELAGTLPDNVAYRTPDETINGLFWAYDGAAQLGTPPRTYNQIIRLVATKKGNSPSDNARLFAFVNVAMADAGILSWDQKYIHEFWRPVLGVREHDTSLGPQLPPGSGSSGPAPTPGEHISGDGDPYWLPFGAPKSNGSGKNFTPPFPAYPSGHATFGAAAFHMTRLFYGRGGTYSNNNLSNDDLFDGLDFVSDEVNGVTRDANGTVRPRHLRKFPGGLWEMIRENGLSRVALGVHWIFDAFVTDGSGDPDLHRTHGGNPYGGVPLGLLIAEDIFGANQKAPSKQPRPPFGPRTLRPVSSGRTATYGSSYIR